MKQFTYIITDEAGIHARPAGLLVKEAAKFASTTTIAKGAKKGAPRSFGSTERILAFIAASLL